MHARTTWLVLSLSAILVAPAAAQITPGTEPGTFIGPSSSQTPYVLPTAPGWETVAVLSVGDQAKENGYVMAGIPDGLGAVAGKFESGRYVADAAYMTVFLNHEIPAGGGIARAHGQRGAFVSDWTIHLNTLQVKWGTDLIQHIYTWDTLTQQFVLNPLVQFSRFCSADLPAPGAFYNPTTGKGFDGRIFMNGEENGVQGRAFGHVVTGGGKGSSYELPYLGRFSWENSVAYPNAGDKTIVVGLDDTSPGGEVYVYVGDKMNSGNPVERAGLQGGSLYGIRVTTAGPTMDLGRWCRRTLGPLITERSFWLKSIRHMSGMEQCCRR
jgi:hypothetical protein